MIQLSLSNTTTGKTKALVRRTFVGRVMSLLFILSIMASISRLIWEEWYLVGLFVLGLLLSSLAAALGHGWHVFQLRLTTGPSWHTARSLHSRCSPRCLGSLGGPCVCRNACLHMCLRTLLLMPVRGLLYRADSGLVSLCTPLLSRFSCV